MAYRADLREEVGSSAQSAGSSMLKLVGGLANLNGPGLFMVRVIVAGSTSAVCTGLTGAVFGSMIFGTAALPFITMACAGFVIGATRWYHDAMAQALLSLDRYPALLRLHLDANYPTRRFRRSQLDAFRSDRFRKSWMLQSMLVVAWLTAQPALDEMRSDEETALVAREKEKTEAKAQEE